MKQNLAVIQMRGARLLVDTTEIWTLPFADGTLLQVTGKFQLDGTSKAVTNCLGKVAGVLKARHARCVNGLDMVTYEDALKTRRLYEDCAFSDN